mmetsp:Transcript_46845/g.124651  ORF Transcript_46845/g.124651 Transcript_46845/m.124651 type:complete len:103 (+) Transcript_46845:752-1060(+)
MVGYADSSRKNTMQFLYRVGEGEYTPEGGQLEIPLGVTVELNGATITSLKTGLDADLSSPPLPGSAGSLYPEGSDQRIIIERTGDKAWGAVSYFLSKSKRTG